MSDDLYNVKNDYSSPVKIITYKSNSKDKENLIKYDEKTLKRAKNYNKKKKSKKKKKFKPSKNSINFYKSREWKELRYRVLRVYKAKCMCCGRTPHDNGIIIHVDHIKPRSKFPKLELSFENMQILCDTCNLGKSNIDNTDWRPLSNNDIYLIKQSQKMG